MIEFKGLSFSMVRNSSEDSGNQTLARSRIGFPSSLFKDALADKLASGKSPVTIVRVDISIQVYWVPLIVLINSMCIFT